MQNLRKTPSPFIPILIRMVLRPASVTFLSIPSQLTRVIIAYNFGLLKVFSNLGIFVNTYIANLYFVQVHDYEWLSFPEILIQLLL